MDVEAVLVDQIVPHEGRGKAGAAEDQISAVGPLLEGSESAVGQNPAMSSWVTRPFRKAPTVLSCSLKWRCSSSSTMCQSIWRSGPSMKPSTDIDIIRMIFLITVLAEAVGAAPMDGHAPSLRGRQSSAGLLPLCPVRNAPVLADGQLGGQGVTQVGAAAAAHGPGINVSLRPGPRRDPEPSRVSGETFGLSMTGSASGVSPGRLDVRRTNDKGEWREVRLLPGGRPQNLRVP